MPALHSFVSDIEMEDNDDFFKFVESKKTLKTIHIFIDEKAQRQSMFLQRIIEILLKPCSPKRPLLHLTMFSYGACDDDVSKPVAVLWITLQKYTRPKMKFFMEFKEQEI